MLSGRKKKDYAAESSADGLETAALKLGGDELAPDADSESDADEPIAEAIAA